MTREIDAEWNFSWSETSKRSDARLPDQQMLLYLRGKDGRIQIPVCSDF